MNTAKLRPDHKLVFMRQWEETESRLRGVNRLIKDLVEIAAVAG